jgi:uncharacterized protein GlcG (DUF336 family)
MAAAMVKAAAIDVPMNIVVIDASGRLKGFLRMDGAVLGSIDVALKKANTSVLFGANSESVWEFCKPGGPAPGLEHTNHVLVTFAGGVPLRSGDEVVGAVGVSGGAVSQDAEVAAAAAVAFGITREGEPAAVNNTTALA